MPADTASADAASQCVYLTIDTVRWYSQVEERNLTEIINEKHENVKCVRRRHLCAIRPRRRGLLTCLLIQVSARHHTPFECHREPGSQVCGQGRNCSNLCYTAPIHRQYLRAAQRQHTEGGCPRHYACQGASRALYKND